MLYAPVLDPPDPDLGAGRPRAARRLADDHARAGADALAHRRARRQKGEPHPGRLVRRLGGRDLGERSGRQDAHAGRDPRAERRASPTAQEYWSAGKAYYDPGKITAPALLVGAEWDHDAPPYMAQTLFPLLTHSPGKRYVMLAEGTHTMLHGAATGSRCSGP